MNLASEARFTSVTV